MCCIIDYGLGLTTVAQTNLLKLDRGNASHIGSHQGHTHRGHEIYARPPTNANQRKSGAGQSILNFNIENPHNPLHEATKVTNGCRLGRGKSWMGQADDSILQVCQLAEFKQTKEWERYPNRFRRLYERLLPENMEKRDWEWPAGKTESEIKLLIQDTIVYTDGSVLVGLHCWARCGHHPWTQCSQHGLNLQLDNGGGSSYPCPSLDCLKRWQWDHTCQYPHRFNEFATKHEMGSPDWNVSMVNIHLRIPLWVYCPGYDGMQRNDYADRLAGKSAVISGLRFGRSEMLRCLRHYLRAQSQRHHNINRHKERDVERGSARQSSLKGRERAIINHTNIGSCHITHLHTSLNTNKCVYLQNIYVVFKHLPPYLSTNTKYALQISITLTQHTLNGYTIILSVHSYYH